MSKAQRVMRERLHDLTLGHWFASAQEDGRPGALLASPYVLAIETAKIFRDAGGCAPDEHICFNERLCEKEFGILDESYRRSRLAGRRWH